MTAKAVVQKELARPSAERIKQAFRSVKGLIEPDARTFGHTPSVFR